MEFATKVLRFVWHMIRLKVITILVALVINDLFYLMDNLLMLTVIFSHLDHVRNVKLATQLINNHSVMTLIVSM